MSESEFAALDTAVRQHVYGAVMTAGAVPSIAATASALGTAEAAVRGTFRRLAEARMLVLQPENDEILMANPFSAVPTPFSVVVGGRMWYGNCIWDALGIPAMLGQPGEVRTACACCGQALTVHMHAGRATGRGIAHFAIAASRWWEDIVFN